MAGRSIRSIPPLIRSCSAFDPLLFRPHEANNGRVIRHPLGRSHLHNFCRWVEYRPRFAVKTDVEISYRVSGSAPASGARDNRVLTHLG